MNELKTKLLAMFNRMNDSKKVYWLSFVIGIVCGTAALLLKNLIHLIGESLVGNLKESDESYLFLAFPLVGIAITVLIVKLLIRDDLGHGVSKVLGAIRNNFV